MRAGGTGRQQPGRTSRAGEMGRQPRQLGGGRQRLGQQTSHPTVWPGRQATGWRQQCGGRAPGVPAAAAGASHRGGGTHRRGGGGSGGRAAAGGGGSGRAAPANILQSRARWPPRRSRWREGWRRWTRKSPPAGLRSRPGGVGTGGAAAANLHALAVPPAQMRCAIDCDHSWGGGYGSPSRDR